LRKGKRGSEEGKERGIAEQKEKNKLGPFK